MSVITRTITQIAVSSAATGAGRDVLYALASDGTVWRLAVRLDEGWRQVPVLPPDAAPQGLPP